MVKMECETSDKTVKLLPCLMLDVGERMLVAGAEVSRIEDNIPGKLFYRGYDLDDIAHALLREKRFGFEEVAYLLLSGELPDSEQLASFKELINDNMPLDITCVLHKAITAA